jgi:antitoxin component of MazEF toxin-antitoxin module
MLTKKPRKIGNSLGVILDKSVCQLVDIKPDSELKIEVHGKQILIEVLSKEAAISAAMARSEEKYSKVYKRLAE